MDYNFTKGQFTEAQLEDAIKTLFTDKKEGNGFLYTHGENLHRKFDEIILEDDLRKYLSERYAGEGLTAAETKKIISHIQNIPYDPLFSGSRDTFWLFNEGFDLARDNARKLATRIHYINFDEPTKNIFRTVNQFSVATSSGGMAQTRRPDMLVFINGIPIAILEFKSAIKEDARLIDAHKQITIRYTRDIPRLMKYCFLAVICDGSNTRLGTPFTPYEYFYSWNKVSDNEKASNGISSLLTMIKGAFSKERLVAILRDFVAYADEKERVVVSRYPQFFGANKMLESIRKSLRPEGDGKGGTYFGATGCGKTETMLFLSRLISLRDNATFKNPTIIILADREDLDTQTSERFTMHKRFLHETNVRSIESRDDLKSKLGSRESGGVFITTIQKFSEGTGVLSARNNIICISDEAHRTQTSVVQQQKRRKNKETGVEELYTTAPFAYCLQKSFPNATYCGFTGTPVDETLAVFGKVVDKYTMKESTDDGITVRITYEPRLARVILSDEQAKKINSYYAKCSDEGANPEQVEESKRAMSGLASILNDPDVIERLALDIVTHYEAMAAEKPKIVQKAMIVCADRKLAFKVYNKIIEIRSDWEVKRKTADESALTADELDKLTATPMINLVATQGADDEKALFDLCGTKEHRGRLDKLFKNPKSNFKIAIVVDMWITGFDVPELSTLYIFKPLQKHTLIQTISRVNRKAEGKEQGLVVDYIGIKDAMLEALKTFGDKEESPIDEIEVSLGIFRNKLKLLTQLLNGFNPEKFFKGKPIERLHCLNMAVEFVQTKKDTETRFMRLSREMKAAYTICSPSGKLTDIELSRAQFFLAIRSILYKQTIGDAPDTETMNRAVEKMVQEAITCTGIENIVNAGDPEDIFGEDFQKQLDGIKLPISKFNALLKLVRKAISAYGKVNKVKAVEFDERLRAVVDRYNNRDSQVFTSEGIAELVDILSSEIIDIMTDLVEDKDSFIALGITFEEKAFYDILIKVRDDNGFEYPDDKCLVLAKDIKALVDDKTIYADWITRNDIKDQLSMDLTLLLYKREYPPEWDEEIFEKVMAQTKNFKKWDK